jgi:hypothetical protein
MFPSPISEAIMPTGIVNNPKKPRAVAFVSVSLSSANPTIKGRKAKAIPPRLIAKPKRESLRPLRFGCASSGKHHREPAVHQY